MGRIAGIFYFDRRPIAPEDEAWVRTALGAGNPLQLEVRRSPGLLMGLARFDRRPRAGELPESQLAAGDNACTWEGRLDNREDLARGLKHPPPVPVTDSGLALKLYENSGVAGLRDLIGDWSLAIWDAGRRAILLASDYAGIRPLYYYRDSQCVLWSTSLEPLARRAGTQGLDDEYVASFLRRGNAPYRTPYRGILPVPPGQAVFATRDCFFTQPFWSLPFHQEVRFQDTRCYEERLRTLFQEAVSVRLPSDSTVCAELSGGLDSSSVVSMASRIFATQPDPAGKLVTFSYQSAESTDKKYIRAVERAIQNPGIHLDLRDYPFLTPQQPGGAAPEGWGMRFAELARRMAALKSTVLLTGQLGDFLMGGLVDDAEQVVDYLRHGHPIQALREALAWSRYLRVPIYSILSRALRTSLFAWSAAVDPTALRGVHNPYAEEDSIAADFRKRVTLEEIERLRRLRWQDASPGQRRRFRILGDTLESRSLRTPERMQDVSVTHPFAHRPLVEYMLTIPPGEVCRPGEPRRLMRRAFSGILPAAVAARKSKATYTAVYRRSLVPLAGELIKDTRSMRLVERGYLDGPSITRRLERLVDGLQCNEAQLRHVILLEFWLRKWERGVSHSADIDEIQPAGSSLTSVGPLPRS